MCEVCGAFQIKNDAAARMEEHLLGRMHLGYLAIREFCKKYQEKIESERAARRAESERRERDRNRGSDRERERERDRDRDRDRERDKKDKEERKRRYGALFASEVACSCRPTVDRELCLDLEVR